LDRVIDTYWNIGRRKLMLTLSNFGFGWLDLTITDGKKSSSFPVSYLCDPLDDIKKVISQKFDSSFRSISCIELDGEGRTLYLTFIIDETSNLVNIVWEEYSSQQKMELYTFPFDMFFDKTWFHFEEILEQYQRDFLLPD